MPRPLIYAATLDAELGSVKVFDIRWKLGQPEYGLSAYKRGHIPSALFVDLDRDLSSPPAGARHPLPPTSTFALTLGRLGLEPQDSVVVYDDVSGMVAARMWWMLTAIGHHDVRLLNGGLEDWVDGGYQLEVGENFPEPAGYPTPEMYRGAVQVDQILDRQVVDVRAPERYVGAHEPVDPRAGHIPGAINIPATQALGSGKFRSAGELQLLYGDLQEPVVSCGSGVVACHTALAMVLAGHEMPEVYVGSFSEWSNSDRPVSTGERP